MPWADWWLATRIARVADIAYLAYLAEPRTLYRSHGANMSLGRAGRRAARRARQAAGFQRQLLRTLRPGDATPAEVAAGWAAFERNVREASALGDSPFRRVLDVTDADRTEAVALERTARVADDARPAQSLWPLLNTAADPWNDAAREGLAAALAAARDTPALAAA
jgi:hypothetical protein